jgi:hypothetical protein
MRQDIFNNSSNNNSKTRMLTIVRGSSYAFYFIVPYIQNRISRVVMNSNIFYQGIQLDFVEDLENGRASKWVANIPTSQTYTFGLGEADYTITVETTEEVVRIIHEGILDVQNPVVSNYKYEPVVLRNVSPTEDDWDYVNGCIWLSPTEAFVLLRKDKINEKATWVSLTSTQLPNRDVIEKLSEQDGKLNYNGQPIVEEISQALLEHEISEEAHSDIRGLITALDNATTEALQTEINAHNDDETSHSDIRQAIEEVRELAEELSVSAQSDWLESDSESPSFIKNKPLDIVLEVSGTDVLEEYEKENIHTTIMSIMKPDLSDIDNTKFDDIIMYADQGFSKYHYTDICVEPSVGLTIGFMRVVDSSNIQRLDIVVTFNIPNGVSIKKTQLRDVRNFNSLDELPTLPDDADTVARYLFSQDHDTTLFVIKPLGLIYDYYSVTNRYRCLNDHVKSDDLATVATTGSYNDLIDKPDLDLKLDKNFSVLPTQTNPLLTDFLVLNRGTTIQKVTLGDLLAQVDNEIFEVVSVLPTTGVANKIYLVPSSDPETQNTLDEFIWVDNAWEIIGTMSVDLSNYFNKTEINSMLDDKADLVDGKVPLEQLPDMEITKQKVEDVLTGDITSHNHATEIGNHNTSETAHNDIRQKVEEAKAIAEGKSRARVFATKSELDTWLLDSENVALLQIGDNFYIEETDKPDYWWNGTTIKELETQKVDLTEYAKSDDLATVATTGSYNDLTNKPTISTNIAADETSDAKTASPKAVKTYVDNAISNALDNLLGGSY